MKNCPIGFDNFDELVGKEETTQQYYCYFVDKSLLIRDLFSILISEASLNLS